MINPMQEDGRWVGEVFYLNNVDTDRLFVHTKKDLFGLEVSSELHGSSKIYEYTGKYNIKQYEFMSEKDQEILQQMTRPRSSGSFEAHFYTNDPDRIMRAWKYIYTNGCVGQRGPF